MRSMVSASSRKAFSWVGENWALVVLWALLLSISVLVGLARSEYSDFFPINGDFQNYNGYRRLLAGQAPFGDFFYYLGLGPLYVNTAVLWLLGNDFTHSLIATYVVSSFALALCIYCVARCNSLSASTSLLLTIFLQLSAAGYRDPLNLLRFFENHEFLHYIYPGVSDRVVRWLLPFLLVLMYLAAGERPRLRGEATRALAWGALLGAGIAWSNDFGISVFLAGCLMFALPRLKDWRRLVRSMPLVVLGAAVGCFLAVSLLTWGNFVGWADYNFRGVASYQFWYYENPATKFLVLGDLPFNLEILCALLLIAYLSGKVIIGGYGREEACLLFLLLTTVIAGYAYAVNSSKAGMFVPASLVLHVTLFSLVLRTAEQRLSPGVIRAGQLVLFLGFVYMVSLQARTTNRKLTATRGVYVPGLRGVLSSYGGELNRVSDQYVHGQTLFSTYASALDVMNDQFQPSGMDYIIHALGDSYRARYLEAFHRSAPRYVTTIREDFVSWELWAKRSNWFFYRELLRNHKPVAVTPYNVLWERSTDHATPQPAATVEATRVSDSQVVLTVRLPSAQDGIADLSFSYSSEWKPNRWRRIGMRRIVNVTDGWSSEWDGKVGGYNLPEAKDRINIPVRLTRGEGRVTLAVFPSKLARIDVRDMTVESLLPDLPGDLSRLEDSWKPESTSACELTDANWERGVSRKKNILLMPNTPGNKTLTLGAKRLRTSDGTIWPIRSQSSDQEWIYVEVEQLDPERMRHPNELRFSR